MGNSSDGHWSSRTANLCEACSLRACGSCSHINCDCYSAFQAWQSYHAATVRPTSKGRDQWNSATAVSPPHNAYTGRHERNLGYRLGANGRRQKFP